MSGPKIWELNSAAGFEGVRSGISRECAAAQKERLAVRELLQKNQQKVRLHNRSKQREQEL